MRGGVVVQVADNNSVSSTGLSKVAPESSRFIARDFKSKASNCGSTTLAGGQPATISSVMP